MNEEIIVTIIVPVYNTEDYLDNCINSILSQSFREIELILINDGSTDGSLEICKKYLEKDHRVKVIDQENKGVSAARNIGVEKATGQYIMFVDSDDYIEEDAVSCMYEAILINQSDLVFEKKVLDGYEISEQEDASFGVKLALEGKVQSACGVLFRKDAFKDIRFVEQHYVNEDSFYMFQCFMKKPKVSSIDKKIYIYTKRENSASRAEFSEKYLDMLFFLEKKKTIIETHFPDCKRELLDLEVRTRLQFLQVLARANKETCQKYEKENISFLRKNYFLINRARQSKHEKRVSIIMAIGGIRMYKFLLYI